MLIEVQGFAHKYPATLFTRGTQGASDISLSVESGEIHGFLGPNGAGKSTTIKALLGLIRPKSGRVELFGKPVSEGSWRSRVGYMPEHPNFYDFLTGHELVTWFGKLAGLSRHESEAEARRQLERVGLSHAMHRSIRGYSKGMLQRAGLAQALLGAPELLILDEPMTGLDPIGRKEIRELILELRSEGKTVFYSTHILPDIEMTCDRATIVESGVTRRSGRIVDILTETTRGVGITISGLDDGVKQRLLSEFSGAKLEDFELSFEITDPEEAAGVVRALLAEHPSAKLVRFEPHRDDLETIFVRSLGQNQPS